MSSDGCDVTLCFIATLAPACKVWSALGTRSRPKICKWMISPRIDEISLEFRADFCNIGIVTDTFYLTRLEIALINNNTIDRK